MTAVLLLALSITQLDDKFSSRMRELVQQNINNYIARISVSTANDSLTIVDTSILHACALTGVAVSRFSYPEASTSLFHTIYGNGEDLELSSSYFKQSIYLRDKIKELGNGQYGPLSLKQSDDWRLSLALNPYYLTITDEKIKLFHPKIVFAAPNAQDVYTVVPIGKLDIKVYDNIISALEPSPFYVFSEWDINKL